MNQTDAIRMIGDVLTQIDMTAGGLSPSDPQCIALLAERDRLDKQQLMLVRQVFDDNTAAFKDATEHLKTANAEVQRSIEHIENIATFIADIRTFVDSVTSLVTTAAGL